MSSNGGVRLPQQMESNKPEPCPIWNESEENACFQHEMSLKSPNRVKSRFLPFNCRHPHLDSPQFRQVIQPSILMTALVVHFVHS